MKEENSFDKDDVEQEMEWLRSINMEKDVEVREAAKEIVLLKRKKIITEEKL